MKTTPKGILVRLTNYSELTFYHTKEKTNKQAKEP